MVVDLAQQILSLLKPSRGVYNPVPVVVARYNPVPTPPGCVIQTRPATLGIEFAGPRTQGGQQLGVSLAGRGSLSGTAGTATLLDATWCPLYIADCEVFFS